MSPAEIISNEKPSTADAFITEIRAAIREAASAEGTALDAAIRAGHLLIRAKENLRVEKRKWSTWLIASDLPQTTANLYKRIAANEDFIRENEIPSIRAADAALRNRATEEEDDDDTGTETDNGVVSPEPPTPESPPPSPSPKSKRQKPPADISAALKPLAPEAVFTALRARFEDEQLKELTTLLVRHLKGETA
jgi:hypothetical protein